MRASTHALILFSILFLLLFLVVFDINCENKISACYKLRDLLFPLLQRDVLCIIFCKLFRICSPLIYVDDWVAVQQVVRALLLLIFGRRVRRAKRDKHQLLTAEASTSTDIITEQVNSSFNRIDVSYGILIALLLVFCVSFALMNLFFLFNS